MISGHIWPYLEKFKKILFSDSNFKGSSIKKKKHNYSFIKISCFDFNKFCWNVAFKDANKMNQSPLKIPVFEISVINFKIDYCAFIIKCNFSKSTLLISFKNYCNVNINDPSLCLKLQVKYHGPLIIVQKQKWNLTAVINQIQLMLIMMVQAMFRSLFKHINIIQRWCR